MAEMIKTSSNCEECIHKSVCAMLDRPSDAVHEIANNIRTDTNGLDIEVTCRHYEGISHSKTSLNRDFGLDCK